MAADDENKEKLLLERVANAYPEAFEELVDRFSGLLYTFIYKHTKQHELTEEIVQDVFMQIWQGRESLAGVKKFSSFLYIMARNHAITAVRRLIRERKNMSNTLDYTEQDISQEDVTEYRLSLIETAVNQLPPQQQKVWILSRRHGMKYKEIALQLDLSPETIKKYLQYANENIINYVSENVGLPVVAALFLLRM